MGYMDSWINFAETVAAIKAVAATMVKQSRNRPFPCPDTLEIHVHTNLFPVSQCLAKIQNACASEAIPLKIDSKLKEKG